MNIEPSAKAAQPTHSSNWFLFLGVIYIFAGIVAIGSPLVITLFSVLFFGVVLVAAGVAGLIHAFWARGWDGFAVQLLAGILATVMGFLLITDAAAGAAVITIILATYFLISGFFRIGFVLTHPGLAHHGALLLSGAITLLLGIFITVGWPGSSFWVIGTFIGVDLIFYGFSMIALARAFAARNKASLLNK
jgi:uncharacterized membrane protein HdeD (DUF308 family)